MDAQEIKDQISLLEEREQELLSEDKLDTDALNATRNKLMELKYELSQQEERTQKQEAVIADTISSIQLPMNYDEITGYPGINDEVLSIVRQALDQITLKHNAELLDVQTGYQEKLKSANETADAASADKSALQAQVDTLTAQMIEKDRNISQLQLEAQDAYSKRDAAMAAKEEAEAETEKAKREAESLKKQVDELEKMVSQQKKPTAPTGTFNFTSILKPETTEERDARLKRMRDEQLNKSLQRWNVDPLPVLNLPEVTQPSVQEDKSADAFQGNTSTDQHTGSTGDVAQAVPGDASASAGEVAPEAPTLTLEALDARVKDLEARMDRLTAPTVNVA